MRCRLVCPFHKADGVGAEVFIQAGFEKFIGMRESIEIKVIQRHSRNCINFDQGVGRALYTAGVPQCVQQATCEGRFAGPQIAFQPDHQTRLQGLRQRGTQCLGGSLIAQIAIWR